MATPNMGLVLPTDHASNDVWDVILDAVFGVIDAHDHSPGKGVKVPSGGLNINADVSWSSSGTSYGISDLKAVDFSPVAAASVTLLADALFVSSADNNLYWRNHTGTNVQLTNGAALNVAAFAGGIGGDYSPVGALEIFDDATDSYWFQQQLGGGVRQYARMRSADLDLYEYKANPAGGVPVQRVRLASPAALAASYTLTFPAALPASKTGLFVDGAGAVTAGSSQSLMIHGSQLMPANNYSTASLILGASGWTFGAAPPNDTVLGPIPLIVGDRIISIQWFFNKTGSASPLTMTLNTRNGNTNTARDTLADVTSGAAQTSVTRTINYTLVAGDTAYVQVQAGGAVMNFSHLIVTYDHP